MRQTLFYLPESMGGIPLFGLGWALGIIALLGAAVIYWTRRTSNWRTALVHWGPTIALAMGVVYFVLPAIERMPAVVPGDDLPNHGVPVRGYGVVLFLACASATALAAQRARTRGISPDTIYQLAFSFFLFGILGARTAFFAQYWDRYQIDSPLDFLWEFINIAEGGLVVYGSLIGALLAFALFTWRHRLSPLQLGDVVAPCLLLGLAIGRIGCFLNGCCWGEISHVPWSVQFPASSPPFLDQGQQGLFWGIRLVPDDESFVVREVIAESPAAIAGLKPGDILVAIDQFSLDVDASGRDLAQQQVGRRLLDPGHSLTVRTADGRSLRLERSAPPSRSLPVHPTQLYSSLGALVLFLMVLGYERLRPPVGFVAALSFTLYPALRFLLEFLRDDEPGAWGTRWTLAQWFSIVVMVAAIGLWAYVVQDDRRSRQPAGVDGEGLRPATARSGTYSAAKASKLSR